MKHITILLWLIFLSYASKAQYIEDYLTIAANNNPGLKSSYSEFEATLQRVAQVKSLPDPTLSFGYFISPVETRVGPQRAKISLSQMLPWFGTLAAKEKSATLLSEAKYQEFLEAKNHLYFKVKSAYYPIYALNGQLKWQKKNLEILETYKTLALRSYSTGKGSMVDVIRVDIMMDEVKTTIELLKEQMKPLETTFNLLLNRGDSLSVVVSDSLEITPDHETANKDSLFFQNPMLVGLELKEKASLANEEVVKKQGLPTIGFGLDYAIVGRRTDLPAGQPSSSIVDNGKNVLMPMISVSLPVFRKKYTSAINETRFIQHSIVSKKENVRNELSSSYEMARYELEKARQMYALYQQQIIRTQQVINLLNSAYSTSGKDFDEVLRMQQNVFKYEMDKVTAVQNFYLAKAKIEYLTAL